MNFNSTQEKSLIPDITYLTGADLNEYPIEDRTRSINYWYLQVANWIFSSNGRWSWDDTNYSDRPTATTHLISGQKEYQVLDASPNEGQDWLEISRAEFIDRDDNAFPLYPVDQKDIGQALTEFMEKDGTPRYFDFNGSSVFLYPAPDYNKDAGLILYFRRAPFEFSSTDTTRQPGFASLFHRVLSFGASYDFGLANNLGNTQVIREEILRKQKEIKNFYGGRDKYEKDKIQRARRSYK